MGTIRSFKARAGRSLGASLVVAVALLVTAVPASAKPGGTGGKAGGPKVAAAPATAGVSATLTPSIWFPGAYCTFDVSYRWAGFKGQDLSAVISVVDEAGATIAVGPTFVNAAGDGKAEFIVNFTGSVPVEAARDIYARGALLSGGVEVSGSVTTSPVVPDSTCGGSYGIRTFTVIDLT
jgi:hypothetical protein